MSSKTNDQQAAILPRTSLIPDPRNAKKHDEKQVAQIAGSIREFGFAAPIVIDEDNNILAGHGRWEAAHKLGLESVPCRRVVGLTKAQKRAFILADNKITLNTSFDEEKLRLELMDMDAEHLALTGFSEDEAKLILNGWDSDIEIPEDGEATHEILRVRVSLVDLQAGKEAVSNALDAAGIEHEWMAKLGNPKT